MLCFQSIRIPEDRLLNSTYTYAWWHHHLTCTSILCLRKYESETQPPTVKRISGRPCVTNFDGAPIGLRSPMIFDLDSMHSYRYSCPGSLWGDLWEIICSTSIWALPFECPIAMAQWTTAAHYTQYDHLNILHMKIILLILSRINHNARHFVVQNGWDCLGGFG